MTTRILLRGGTAAEWTSENPTLAAREVGVETDTHKAKIGDGTTAWTSLSYLVASSGSVALDDLSDVTITAAASGDILRHNGTAWVDAVGTTHFQAADAELAAIAGLTSAADTLPYFTGSGTASLATFTAAGRAIVDDADATAQRVTLGLVIGTNVQAYDADLAALAGVTSAADALPYFTGSGAAAVTTLTSFMRTVLDDTTAAAARTTLAAASLTPTVGTALATTGTIDLDFSSVHDTYQTITLTGNPTFTTSNRAAGKSVTVILTAGGSSRTITWPSWIPLGAALPTTLASGKVAVFTVTMTSTTDATAVASYSAQP